MEQPNDVDGQMSEKDERRDALIEGLRLCGVYPGKPEWRQELLVRLVADGFTDDDLELLATYSAAEGGSHSKGARILTSILKTGEWKDKVNDLRALRGAATKRDAKAKKPEPGESLRSYETDVSRDRRVFYRVAFEGVANDKVAEEFGVTTDEVKAICEQEEKDYASPVDRSKSVRISRQLRRDASREGDS